MPKRDVQSNTSDIRSKRGGIGNWPDEELKGSATFFSGLLRIEASCLRHDSEFRTTRSPRRGIPLTHIERKPIQ